LITEPREENIIMLVKAIPEDCFTATPFYFCH
jgi:hypothetical protein